MIQLEYFGIGTSMIFRPAVGVASNAIMSPTELKHCTGKFWPLNMNLLQFVISTVNEEMYPVSKIRNSNCLFCPIQTEICREVSWMVQSVLNWELWRAFVACKSQSILNVFVRRSMECYLFRSPSVYKPLSLIFTGFLFSTGDCTSIDSRDRFQHLSETSLP